MAKNAFLAVTLLIALFVVAGSLTWAKEECTAQYGKCIDASRSLPGSLEDKNSELFKAWGVCSHQNSICEFGEPQEKPVATPTSAAASTASSKGCDPAGSDDCVAWARAEIEKLGCHVDAASFGAAVEDLYLNRGCRLQDTRWYDVASGATVQGRVENGLNTDSAGCIARYTPAAYLKEGGGYFRTPKEALNGPLRNKQLSGCLYDSYEGTTDASVLTGPIMGKIISCGCAAQGTGKPRGGDNPSKPTRVRHHVDLADVLKKCEDVIVRKDPSANINNSRRIVNKKPTLSEDEFLAYVQVLEQGNANMTRNQLIAKLHQETHPEDVERRIEKFDLRAVSVA